MVIFRMHIHTIIEVMGWPPSCVFFFISSYQIRLTKIFFKKKVKKEHKLRFSLSDLSQAQKQKAKREGVVLV